MRIVLIILFAVLLIGAVAGSRLSPRPVPTVPTVEFGDASLSILYATTTGEREKGLGGRDFLPADEGMLFVFPRDDFYGFWMKDTKIPLDMFWLDDKGQVVFIEENVATSSYPHVFYPLSPARYVLETNAGFGKDHGIATGTPLRLQNMPIVSE